MPVRCQCFRALVSSLDNVAHLEDPDLDEEDIFVGPRGVAHEVIDEEVDMDVVKGSFGEFAF